MRNEELYMADIVEAADAIQRFLNGVDYDRYTRDEILRSAVLHKLTIIGEATSRLSKARKDKHPDIPWQNIIGFRNIVIHAYFAVDWDVIWNTATVRAPELRNRLAQIIKDEFGAPPVPPVA